jgi:hypothetical protein
MDSELTNDEGAVVGRHVRDCSECGGRVDAYDEVSRALVAPRCDPAMARQTRRRLPLWAPVVSTTAAAAMLLLVFLLASINRSPVLPRVVETLPPVVLETLPSPVKKVHRRRIAAMKTRSAIGHCLSQLSESPSQANQCFLRALSRGNHIHGGPQYGVRRIYSSNPYAAVIYFEKEIDPT